MGKQEVKTDLWVLSLLQQEKIELTPQGCDILEISQALKTASKSKTKKEGYPEYCGVVKDFVVVIEDKAKMEKHLFLDEKGLISQETEPVKNYAINGALHYGLHILRSTSYRKVFAIGVSGDAKKHRITPLFINDRGDYQVLDDVETFVSFSESNINEYYTREVLKESTDTEKTTAEILKDAAIMNSHLNDYGKVDEKSRPVVVSGILLALREMEYGNFTLDALTGDKVHTDGMKIFEAVKNNLYRSDVTPDVKRDKLLSQFAVIKDNESINTRHPDLRKTPLKHYAEFLYERVYKNIRYNNSSEDFLGRFYSEFVSYSGGDGQSLGIVLTPKHIADLFCDLVELKPTDTVIDPCCGTAGFLIAAMHRMMCQAEDEWQRENIRRNQLHGIEVQSYMFTIATTNMILRGDGKSNLQHSDFLTQNPSQLQLKGCRVGMMNPPYSQGGKNKQSLYEINFTEHLLKSLVKGGKAVVIIPQSSMTGKTKEEQAIKANILKHSTLEGVITLNKNTFYGVGTNPCIAVFTAGIPHGRNHVCKFINFEDDGFEVSKHIGLLETASAKDKRQHLLDVWFDRIEAETKFCVKTTIEAEDEWLHSFYYFNDEIPTEQDFENTMADYLTFEFNMIAHGRGDLFDSYGIESGVSLTLKPYGFEEVEWGNFYVRDMFETMEPGKSKGLNHLEKDVNGVSYLGATNLNNGVLCFVKPVEDMIQKGNCIAFIRNGEGSMGYSVYKAESFIATSDITLAYSKHLNKYTGMFITTIADRIRGKYNFGYKRSATRLAKEVLSLPVTANGSPDWTFMEVYMREIEQRITLRYLGRKETFTM